MIQTVADLQSYLHAAMQLEHATIPPYLMALYSIRPGTNSDAVHVIRVVAVEEMLHLTLAANLLNAVGGTPDLTQPDFVPLYPAYLPDGEHDFTVDLQPFSQDAIQTFLKIERPKKAPDETKRVLRRERHGPSCLGAVPDNHGMSFHSIGEFYEEIKRGIAYLDEVLSKEGKTLFVGAAERQVTPEYYYSGGGALIAVHDRDSADKAIDLIIEQGEGLGEEIYDSEGELAHYFRFKQLLLGHYYKPGDTKDPTGPPVTVDWEAVFPFKTNARLADYPAGSELHEAAIEFNKAYAAFLALLTKAYNGEPALLIEAVPYMFGLRNKINQLIRNPLPGAPGLNAAPTFEMAPAPELVTS